MVYENCSDTILLLATVGGVAVYLFIGFLVGIIISEITKRIRDDDSRETLIALGIIFWPLALAAMVLYIMWFCAIFPCIGATKEQLDEVENRLSRKIDYSCSSSVDVSGNSDIIDVDAPFKVGDIITGIVPQTDKYGKNMSYNHLYKGCRCRVLSIKNNGSMKVILIGHKDKEANADSIGETFTVPARNFTKVKKPAKKRTAVKKKTRR